MARLGRYGALIGLLLCQKSAVQADLPVHCMGDELLGEWTMKITLPSQQDPYSMKEACGHKRPDDYTTVVSNGDDYSKWWYDRLEESEKGKFQEEEYRVCVPHASGKDAKICKNKDSCSGECLDFDFTLVYDEGVLLDVKNLFGKDVGIKILLFFKYGPKQKGLSYPDLQELEKWESYCGDTVSGFWTTKGDNLEHDGEYFRGCAIAKKVEHVNEHSSEMRGKGADSTGFSDLVSQTSELLQTSESMTTGTKLRQRAMTQNRARMDAFLDSEVKISRAYIDRINAMDLGWEASEDSANVFTGRTYRDTLRAMGYHHVDYAMLEDLRRQFLLMQQDEFEEDKSVDVQVNEQITEALQNVDVLESATEKSTVQKLTECALKHLPKRFSWADPSTTGCSGIVDEAKNQGSCGSCYAFALTSAATSRLRIANHPDPKCSKFAKPMDPGSNKSILNVTLSPQSILDCSYANQACQGGYPILAGYHAYADGLYDSSCDPYTASSQECQVKDTCPRYFPENVRYAGGRYGYSVSMEAMMIDLIEYGPLSVAIESPVELQLYKKGVFAPLNKKLDSIKGKHSYWLKTNHALMLVGWDTVKVKGKDVPCWIIVNSWGKKWGDHGTFLIKRGSDSIAVETMPVSVRFTKEPTTTVSDTLLADYKQCSAK